MTRRVFSQQKPKTLECVFFFRKDLIVAGLSSPVHSGDGSQAVGATTAIACSRLFFFIIIIIWL